MSPRSESKAPELELDWEEGLFRVARSLWRAVFRRTPAARPGEVRLDGLERRLASLASMLAGRPVRVLPGRDRGGIRGADLLLPPSLAVSSAPEENALLYVVRAVLGAELIGRGGDEAAVLAAVARLKADYDGFGPAWEQARAIEGHVPLAESWLWGPSFTMASDPGGEGSAGEPDGGVDSDATEIEAPAIEDITLHRMGEEPLELPVHAFEKVEMAESFAGSFRRPDGSDELDHHLEALQEVQLGHLLRGGPSAGSLMKADIQVGAEVPDVAHIEAHESFVAYPEWDGRRTRYRPDWCRVYPTVMPRGSGAWASEVAGRHRRTIERLHGQLLRHRDRLHEQRRQLDGEDVDIEALSQAWATLQAGRTPSRRLYVRQARQRRDLATTVLLDVSLSTDSWVANRRVLDVAKESVLVLCEVVDRLGDDVQVLAFASHTRHKVRCWTVKDYGEPWELGRSRLGLLEPQGYTRIGPALRHATAQLVASKARHKLLLLVSDCKPTDYDRYEGRHGMSDVHKALIEARQRDVRVHALAIDAVAKSWMPGMFGPAQWAVLPRPEDLPEALTQAYGRSA